MQLIHPFALFYSPSSLQVVFFCLMPPCHRGYLANRHLQLPLRGHKHRVSAHEQKQDISSVSKPKRLSLLMEHFSQSMLQSASQRQQNIQEIVKSKTF